VLRKGKKGGKPKVPNPTEAKNERRKGLGCVVKGGGGREREKNHIPNTNAVMFRGGERKEGKSKYIFANKTNGEKKRKKGLDLLALSGKRYGRYPLRGGRGV